MDAIYISWIHSYVDRVDEWAADVVIRWSISCWFDGLICSFDGCSVRHDQKRTAERSHSEASHWRCWGRWHPGRFRTWGGPWVHGGTWGDWQHQWGDGAGPEPPADDADADGVGHCFSRRELREVCWRQHWPAAAEQPPGWASQKPNNQMICESDEPCWGQVWHLLHSATLSRNSNVPVVIGGSAK